MLRTVALSGLAAIVIAVDWLRFEEPHTSGGRAFVVAVLAIAPVLLRPFWPRAIGVAVSIVLALWVALSVSPFSLWPGGSGYFGPLGSRFGNGFGDFYEFRLPIDPTRHPEMHDVILVAIFAFTLVVALGIASRRVLLAVIAFLIGAGWPATLLAGGNELGRGAVILTVALVLLAGITGRANRIALGATGVVILGALLLSSSAAVAKSAFLDWQQWDLYTRQEHSVNVRYVWDARYSGIRFPNKRTTVLTIRAPSTPQYWRATVLDRFDGTRWLEYVPQETQRERRELAPDGVLDRAKWVAQEVKVGALDDDHLIGGTALVSYDVDAPAYDVGQGVTRVLGGLEPGDTYTVWSYLPSPTPEQLARDPASYPRALTDPGRDLDVARDVTMPPFGRRDRNARVNALLVGRLQPYEAVFNRARAVAGQTSSPYAAAVAIEAWLRSTGGFTYAEQPGTTPGLPPLVGFIVDTKTGYCQHFAGGMALMLRLLGIPARVVAGFAPGHYRRGEWTVTDHDAHAWVEVWFKHYGWLPFDPTPGRGRLSGTYSSSALGFNTDAAARLLNGLVKGGEVFGSSAVAGIIGHDPNRRTPRTIGDSPGDIGLAPTPQVKHTPSLILFLLLLAAGVAAVVVVLKFARRRLRYLTRDPRRIAAACARELADYARDQRQEVPNGATLHEIGETVRSGLGVDASDFTREATAARYGRPDEAGHAARRARAELRALKSRLRRSMVVTERLRGLFSVRSLGLG